MPESANPPPSDAELHAIAARLHYAINVIPQPPRTSFGDNEIIEAEGAWQWSVKCRGNNMAYGHSCGSPELAFDRALSTLRELLCEPISQAGWATGGWTGVGGSTPTDAARANLSVSGHVSISPQLTSRWAYRLQADAYRNAWTPSGVAYAETSGEF